MVSSAEPQWNQMVSVFFFLVTYKDRHSTFDNSVRDAIRRGVANKECTFEQINFVAGRRGAVVEDDFYNKLRVERLNVQAGKKEKILAAHVQRICEVHHTVKRSYYQQMHKSSGADATTSMENIGEQVCV